MKQHKSTLTDISIDSTHYGSVDKYDTIKLSDSSSAIIINKVREGEYVTITVIPFVFSKYRLVNMLKFAWIKLKILFKIIK